MGALFNFFFVASVIRLSLGRRLVNLLPVAQRTNTFSQMASSPDHGSLVVRSSLTSTMKTLFRFSLGRRSVNLLPVAQRTNAFTNGVVDRPRVVGREFESHVHHENAF